MTATLTISLKGGGLFIVPVELVYSIHVEAETLGFGFSANRLDITPMIQEKHPTIIINGELLVQTGASTDVMEGLTIQHLIRDPNTVDLSSTGIENEKED